MSAKLVNGSRPAACLEAALRELEAGRWPVPIHSIDAKVSSPGKAPIGQAWGKDRPDEKFLRSTWRRHPKAGVGLLLGAQGGVVDIDIDQPEYARETLARLFPDGIPPTMGWSNADGKFHLLFLYDERLSRYRKAIVKGQVNPDGEITGNAHYAGLEIRIGAATGEGKQLQTVIPPSLMSNGQARRWNEHKVILTLPESVFADLDRYAVDKPADVRPKSPAPSSAAISSTDRYVRRALEAELHAVEQAGEGSRNATLNRAAFSIGQFVGASALGRHEAETLLLDAALRAGLGEAESKATIRSGLDSGVAEPRDLSAVGRRKGKPPGDIVPPASPTSKLPDRRVPVEINPDRYQGLAGTLAALPADPDLYVRGNILVRITRETEDTARLGGGIELRRALGSPRVVMIGEAALSCRMTQFVEFFTWFKASSGEDASKQVHPPRWLVSAVLEHGEYPGVRPLLGIAEVPFPRADGSLLTTPGYDLKTGVYYAPSVAIDPLSDRPTKADATEAAKLLLALVEQFPFASGDDAAVWLAALLTVIARPGIDGPVPGIAFNGNRAGLGKGLAIDCLSVIANGRPVPCTSYPRDDAEAAKLKTALALAVTLIVHLDNLGEGRSYGGGSLDSAITSMTVSERILGLSKTTEGLELRCVWFLSGNNISPGRDAYRRWLVCNLITELERPEERRGLTIVDLLAYTRKHRAELVRAALVILKAHAVAEHPTGDWAPLGSFEQWDRVVRGAVWFATGRDCNATRRTAADSAPERSNKLALLEAWRELPGGGEDGGGVTSEKAIRWAFGTPKADPEKPDLGDVLSRFSRDGKTVTARTLGNVIRGMKGQNISGLSFRSDAESNHSALWRVVSVNPCGPARNTESEESEECDSRYSQLRAETDHNINVCGKASKDNWNGLDAHSSDSSDSVDGREVFTL
jgi:Bifunctional DNA primase/polymerase, N-terminal